MASRPHDLALLALGSALLLAGASLRPESGATLSLAGQPIPPLCSWKAATGLDCAGCGLTRSVVATCHGDLAAAFALHLAGPFIALFAAAQIPYRTWRLATGRTIPRLEGFGTRYLLALAVLSLTGWIVRLVLPAVF